MSAEQIVIFRIPTLWVTINTHFRLLFKIVDNLVSFSFSFCRTFLDKFQGFSLYSFLNEEHHYFKFFDKGNKEYRYSFKLLIFEVSL